MTDMMFIEAQPFEREYSQSQQMGGGGGGEGGEEDEQGVTRRQKEIIAATFNQIRDKSKDKAAEAENAKFLSDMQAKLRDQSRSLANRMKSRELAQQNAEFQSFAKDMEEAAKAMGEAVETLKKHDWKTSIAPEQKALQHLLRAEATRQNIQVAFGQRGGGGGGGGAGRDLDSLFDLELDTEKNQYETGAQAASSDRRQKELDDALQKLEQLARRQQELAQQQRDKQQSPQQRWQQEMLRREAEELKKKMRNWLAGSPGRARAKARVSKASRVRDKGRARVKARVRRRTREEARGSRVINSVRQSNAFLAQPMTCVRLRIRKRPSRRQDRPKLGGLRIV